MPDADKNAAERSRAKSNVDADKNAAERSRAKSNTDADKNAAEQTRAKSNADPFKPIPTPPTANENEVFKNIPGDAHP